MSNDEKIAAIRQWLRFHGDYDVNISLHNAYATIGIAVTVGSRVVFQDIGMDFGKRLDKVIEYLGVTLPPMTIRCCWPDGCTNTVTVQPSGPGGYDPHGMPGWQFAGDTGWRCSPIHHE